MAGNTIYGGPTKRFFVSMLTRDIDLDDAILDLIDNCIDGTMRSKTKSMSGLTPFDGFEANLSITSEKFVIQDNCGGIPKTHIDDAFSLGRPSILKDNKLPTIGMYGIGMKRAIFKMGQQAMVKSVHTERSVKVEYSSDWLRPDNDSWDLPIEDVKSEKKKGVKITVTQLKPEISKSFGSSKFLNDLAVKISEYFGYIMQKGFKITINGKSVSPSTLPLLSTKKGSGESIMPFDYLSRSGDVDVKVTVGFFRPLAREDEIDEETISTTGAEKAGITVICNDRVVLLHDRTIKTGWGAGGVPRYHPQFRAIAGLVVLSSKDASQLPISTTKRDLDAGSELYLNVRQVCIEAIKMFTDFTNKWKGREKEANKFFEKAEKTDVRRHVNFAKNRGSSVRNDPQALRFKPDLPKPKKQVQNKRISFVRSQTEIRIVSTYLFGNPDEPTSEIGAACFDQVLESAE